MAKSSEESWKHEAAPRAAPGRGRDSLDRSSAAGDGDHAAAHHLDMPELAHQLDEGVDLLGRARHLEDEGLDRAVDHAGSEDIGDAQGFDALLAAVDDL